MKVVFADTGYWVAVLSPKDDWKERATAASRTLGKVRIVTTEMVLDELLAGAEFVEAVLVKIIEWPTRAL